VLNYEITRFICLQDATEELRIFTAEELGIIQKCKTSYDSYGYDSLSVFTGKSKRSGEQGIKIKSQKDREKEKLEEEKMI
jgi:hypothetical protein